MTVPVLVLEPLAGKCRAARGSSHQKSFGAAVCRRPDQVTYPLKAKHRVVDKERNGRNAMGGIRSAGRNERRHRPRLGNSLLENLPVERLAVIEQSLLIDRLVELTDVRVDADLSEKRFHSEGAGLIRNDRHDELA